MQGETPRGLGRDDFLSSRPIAFLADETYAGYGCTWDDAWGVAPRYEVRGAGAERYLAADPPGGPEDGWREYLPLRDEPDLFLAFARLAHPGEDLADERVMEWVGRHGLLGVGPPAEHPEAGHDAGWYGRPEDSLAVFRDEQKRAAIWLSWVEPALRGDEEAAFWAMLEQPVVEVNHPRPDRLADLDEDRIVRIGARYWSRVADDYEGDTILLAIDHAAWEVNEMIRRSCFRTLKPLVPSNRRRVIGGWGFTSLLGAMYLQASWLLEAGFSGERGGEAPVMGAARQDAPGS